MSKLVAIEPTQLSNITGGRQSSSSQQELKTLVQSTGEAVKDLVRQQQSQSSSSSQMLLPMMIMMMRR